MAAVTHAAVVQWSTAAGTKTYTATPAAGDLIVVIAPTTGTAAGTTAVTDNNPDGLGTYTQIGPARTWGASTGVITVWVRNALIGNAVSTVWTAVQAGSSGGGLDVFRASGMTRTGAAAVRQVTGQSGGASGATPAPVMAAAVLTGNPVIAAACCSTNSTANFTPRAGYTEATDAGYGTPAAGFETIFRSSGETGTTLTWGSAAPSAFGTVAVELDTSAPDDSPPLEASGFGPFTGVSPADTINSITATIGQWSSDPGMAAPTYQLRDGTAAQIGTAVTGTVSASTGNTDTATWTGVTYSQLATLRLRVYAHQGSAAPGATQSVDVVQLSVTYTPSPNRTASPGTAAGTGAAPAPSAATASGAGGGTVTITGTGSGAAAAAVTTQNVTNPAWNGTSTPAGDLILLWATCQTTSTTWTCPGFTAVTAVTGQNSSAQLLYKTSDGTEGATFTVTSSASRISDIAAIALAGQAAAGSGFDPAPASSGQILAALSTSLPATGVTTANPGDLLIWFGTSRVGSGSPANITPPAGFTTQLAQVNAGTSGARVGVLIATATQPAAGATGTETGTTDITANGGALLVAVTPAPASGGTANAGPAAGAGSAPAPAPAIPGLELRGAQAVTTGAGSATLAVPAQPCAVGDLIFIWAVVGFTSITWTSTAGDNLTAETAVAGTNLSTQLFHKIADSADVAKAASSGSYLLTISTSHAWDAIIGVVPVTSTAHPFDPADTPGSGQANAASTAVTAPSVTTSSAGDLLVWLGATAATAAQGGIPEAITPPAGYSVPAGVTQANSTGSNTVNTGVILACATQAAAGATGAQAGSITNSRVSAGLLLAVKAAAVVPIAGVVSHLVAGVPASGSFQVIAKTAGATSCRLAVSAAADMSAPAYVAAQAPDTSGYVRFTAAGLAASTRYWCQLTDTPPGGTETPIGAAGSCKTLPAAGTPASFTVALVSCIAGGDTTTPPATDAAITDWISYNADLNVFTGDFDYSGTTSTDLATQVGVYESQIGTVPSLASMVSTRWGYYCRSDHEAGPDNGDSDNPYTATNIAAAQQVFPMGALGDTATPPRGLYQAWVAGRVRFIMTDVRNTDRSPGANTDDAAKTMLGATQLAWLYNQLIQPEPVKVIITDPGWMGAPTTTNGPDKWWSYATERDAILSYITAHAAQAGHLLLWHGDTHAVACTTGPHNAYGGFPVYCAAPMLNTGGGLNLATFDQVWNNSGGECRLYGRIAFTDDGSSVTVTFQGWDAATATARVTQTDVFITGIPAGPASGTGAAPSPAPATAVAVHAGLAAGAGTSPAPATAAATTVAAGLAPGQGSAPQPAPGIEASRTAGPAAGTGTAPAPAAATLAAGQGLAGAPSGTGQAPLPQGSPAATAIAPAPAGHGTAFAPTLAITVTAGPASGSGQAPVTAPAAGVTAGAPTGTGAAPGPAIATAATAALAAGTGQAPAASPAGAASGTANARPAAGTGASPAPAPAAAVSVTAGTAAAAGQAPPGVPAAAVRPGPAAGNGQAPGPSAEPARNVSVPLTAATGTAPAPAAATASQPPAGTAAADGQAPPAATAAQGITAATAGPASSAGQAPAPSAAAQSAARPGTAQGTGTAPAASQATAVHAGPATAAGQAPPPAAALTVTPAAAPGGGQAPGPAISTIPVASPPAGPATGTGQAPVPSPAAAVTIRPDAAQGTGEATGPGSSAGFTGRPATGTGAAPAPAVAAATAGTPAATTGTGAAPPATGQGTYAVGAGQARGTGLALPAALTQASRAPARAALGTGGAPRPAAQAAALVAQLAGVTARPPRAGWAAGTAHDGQWAARSPASRWAAKRPTGRWSARTPAGGWAAGPPHSA